MKENCEVIRDLLPLYADDVCSAGSRGLVEAHIRECPECRSLLEQLRDGRLEKDLSEEKQAVLQYGEKRFKRRSAAIGTLVAGLFMIPILVCLIVNIASGAGLGWFFVVLASLAVAASLTVVPLMVPEDKLFWTFCAFCLSLMLLLAVICLYTRGSWFWIASSAALFGLAVIFLPFVVRAKPVRRVIGGARRPLLVLAADLTLFVYMMRSILAPGFSFRGILLSAGVVAGLCVIAAEILRGRETENRRTGK